MGWRGRGGGRSGPWPGRGPFSHLPPWQRPGWLFGYGGGPGYGYWGGGFGRGVGYGGVVGYGYPRGAYNPWVCQRFPWLPRWWWANPSYYGYGAPYYTGYPGYGHPSWPYPTYPSEPYTTY